ncbi:succinic semialdehyde dehydrogenase [Paraoerskovia marina]|uniref:succinic semialdehyde dehydrogenase n=1 Tax=Paraoerskovia marina TaxID=545619 RepID=UPI000492BEB8|nr:succinic semialdehyde dehydrogenase [Paraoerskovia marina]
MDNPSALSASAGPLDPEHPASSYALEPDVATPLIARIVTSQTSGTHTSELPFTGAPLVTFPTSSDDDVELAFSRARAAQPSWAATALRERTAVLRRFADLVLERQTEVLDIVQMETGKSRTSAFDEVAYCSVAARHFSVRAGRYLADRREPGMFPVLTSVTVDRRPVGVVGVVSPWNYPLTLSVSELLPALVAGNAAVLRPDPQTTLTALWAVELLAEAGLPDGVVQVVAGGGEIGAAVVDRADHIAFTGSTPTGRVVGRRAGERLIGATLELGGKNPLYVADDVDPVLAASGVARACFANTGQLCVSIERLYVHGDVLDEFLEVFVPLVRDLRLGTGLDYGYDIGSLTSQAQLDRVQGHVEDAVARGARVLAGGVHRTDVGPYSYAPTVLSDVPDDAVCTTEETFGPVVAITVVGSDDEAVERMNATQFGLNASVWTGDTRRGRRIAARIDAGTVGVNDGFTSAWGSVGAPQGGHKSSGLGRRHGREAIEAMTESRSIVVQRGVMRGLSLDTLYDTGAARATGLLTGALRLMNRLRLP